MDKNGVNFWTFLSSGQKWCCFVCKLLTLSEYIFTFVISGKTEAGSAGEQPARDSLTADENVESKGCFERPFDIF